VDVGLGLIDDEGGLPHTAHRRRPALRWEDYPLHRARRLLLEGPRQDHDAVDAVCVYVLLASFAGSRARTQISG
jgi:hypothetical protein